MPSSALWNTFENAQRIGKKSLSEDPSIGGLAFLVNTPSKRLEAIRLTPVLEAERGVFEAFAAKLGATCVRKFGPDLTHLGLASLGRLNPKADQNKVCEVCVTVAIERDGLSALVAMAPREGQPTEGFEEVFDTSPQCGRADVLATAGRVELAMLGCLLLGGYEYELETRQQRPGAN